MVKEIEFVEVTNEKEFNPLVINENAPYTQAFFYGQWQEKMGRSVRRFVAKREGEIVSSVQMVVYPLIGNKNYIVAHHGPVIKDGFTSRDTVRWKELLTTVARTENAVFVKMDFFPQTNEKGNKILELNGFHRSEKWGYHSSYVQPKYEWVLDINKPEDEILSNMHQKTRYNIGLARRKGVSVEISENFHGMFNTFWEMSSQTAARDGFKLHSKEYYKIIFENLAGSDNAFLAIAKTSERVLAMTLVVIFGKTAMYLFGASSDEQKNLMAPYLAQWEGILEAKKRGAGIYNFGGYRGPDNFYSTYAGLSTFKERFGGRMLEYSDYYDLIINPVWYKMYNLRKKLRNK